MLGQDKMSDESDQTGETTQETASREDLPPEAVRPGERFLPVDRYVTPEQFDRYRDAAYDLGFAGVASGPMVRSSFRAGVLYEATRTGRRVEDLLAEAETVVVPLVGMNEER